MRIRNNGGDTIFYSGGKELHPKQEIEIDQAVYEVLLDSRYGKFIEKIDPEIINQQTGQPSAAPLNIADINYVCTLWTSNGMGRGGEEVLLALDRLGIKINIIPIILEKDGLNKRTLELLEEKYDTSNRTIFYTTPEHYEKYATRENYGIIAWDTTKAPQLWVREINKHMRKIYPISHFSREVVVKSGVAVPAMTLNQGIDSKYFPKLERDWTKDFTFLTVGDLSTRKGIDVLINAFEKAFPKEKDVKLILKSNHSLEWGKIKKPKDDRIEVIIDRLSPKEFLKLFKRSHCMVFPSRAEGFGLPALEAMATGMTTIIHNWSGLSMMTNDKYNYPCPSGKAMKAPEWHYPDNYGDIGNWMNPSEEKLIELMRYVYQRRDEAKAKGEAAAKWIRNNWDWDTPVMKMWSDINDIVTNTWGDFYTSDTLTKNNVQDSVNSHKELFWVIRGFKPDKVIEAGTGTGEMSGFLTWKEQKINGVEPTNHHPKIVIATDNDKKVIRIAKRNLESIDGTPKLVEVNVFNYEEKADLIFSQGLLEHFSDKYLIKMVTHQLKQAPILIHSVPNNDYSKRDFGNERLLTDAYYYNLFKDFDLTIYRYWDENGKKTQSILVFKRPSDIKTSIIMPVYNAKDMTIKAIECVRKYTKDYELIVIDNNSNDGIEKWLDEQKDIRVVHVNPNLGVPKAKNLAMALAKGKYICFLDNDTEAGEGWLDGLLEVLQDPTVGFTGEDGYRINKEGHNFCGDNFKANADIEWAAHSIFVFRREILKEIGLLIDRDMWCCEDVDQCCKIRGLGYCGKMPEKPVNIKHFGSRTAVTMPLNKNYQRFHDLSEIVWNEHSDIISTKGFGLKIDIGVGDAPAEGYIHVDIQKKPHVEVVAEAGDLPFESNSLKEVRNAHLIEHFWKDDAPPLLREWHRVLEEGGKLRMICPDLLDVFKKIQNNEVDLEQGFKWIFGGHLDQYDIHHWGYTEQTLRQLMESCGFTDIVREENRSGWLQLVGKKVGLRVGYSFTHHHIAGGGENLGFKMLDIFAKQFNNLDVISGDWEIDPKRLFDVSLNAKIIKEPADNYDLFINYSHHELKDPIGKKNIAYILYPQFDWGEKIKKYDLVVTQSEFVRNAIKKNWDVDSVLIHPPTDLTKFYSLPKKKQILTVGRFFWVKDGNNKNQHILAQAFRKMPKGWKMIMVGSVQDEAYFTEVKKAAEGLDIEFIHDINFEELTKLYAESAVYWHGAGYGAQSPSGYEHFGMVGVEALASGCKTIVHNSGGIAEIDGVETWNTLDELVEKTLSSKKNKPNLEKYSIPYVTNQWKETLCRLRAR